MAVPRETRPGVGRLRWETFGILLVASALGGYAGWMAADLAPRWLTVPAIAVVTGWLLLTQTGRQRFSFVCYAAGALLLCTPVLLLIPDVRASPDLGVGAASMVLLEVNALLVLAFLVPAVLLGYLGYRIDRHEGRP